MRVLLGRDGVVLRQFADVGAGDESLFARAGEDGNANRGVVLDVDEGGAQFFHGRHVERVEHLGAVDSDVGDGVFLFEENVFEGHKIRF